MIVVKATSNFCLAFPSFSLVNFLQCTFLAGFGNNFQDHRRLLEQLFRVIGNYQKAGTSFRKRSRVRILHLGSDFIVASRTIFGIYSQKTAKHCENQQRKFKKYFFGFLEPLKNIHLVTLSLQGVVSIRIRTLSMCAWFLNKLLVLLKTVKKNKPVTEEIILENRLQ
jgi:hypothetical protein